MPELEGSDSQKQEVIRLWFVPDNVAAEAIAGELLLTVAHRVGVKIPTGCLMGSCHACEVDLDRGDGSEPKTVCACITAVPDDWAAVTVNLLVDPSW